jgi:hypothetical protein
MLLRMVELGSAVTLTLPVQFFHSSDDYTLCWPPPRLSISTMNGTSSSCALHYPPALQLGGRCVPIDFLLPGKHCPTAICLARQVSLPRSHEFKVPSSRYVWLQCLQHLLDIWGPFLGSPSGNCSGSFCSSPRIQVPQI